jgi:hypothetical protein
VTATSAFAALAPELLVLLLSAAAQEHQEKPTEVRKKFARASRVVTDRLRETSPCEVSKLTAEEIWKPAQEVLDQEQEADGDPGPGIFLSIAAPNQMPQFGGRAVWSWTAS